jgi:signal transduction histidine kinase
LAIKKAPNSIEPYWMVFANLNYARTFSDFETKLKYTNNAINNASKTGDAHLLLQSHTALADLYIQFKKYNKALKLCEESLISAHNYNLNDTVIRLHLLLANIYYAQKNYSKSLKYVDSIKASAYPEWIKIHVNELTFNNLYELGDYKNAFLEAKNQAIYIESLLVEKEDKAYAEYANKYEPDKKIQENILLKKDNQIKNLTISKEKNKRNLFLAIAMVVLLGLIFMYYRYRSKKKTSELLAVKNQTITKQNQALEEANLTKQKFFSIIAHDLINPFNAILGYTSLLENDFNSFSNSEKQEFVSIINKHAIQNYNLVKNLLDWARTQQDRITLNKTKLNIKQTVSHVMEAYNVLASKKHIKTALIIDNNISVYADNNCLKTVLANLYSNAIKFSAEGSTITIKASCNNANSTIAIQDQGIGMTQLQQDNLFCITKTSTTKGTQKEKGTGLGLLISKELIDLHNGTLTVISAPGRGTTISVTLPKK